MALPASQGLVWFREALRALKNQPVALSGIVVFNLLMMGILSSLPIVGLVLASLWMPFGVVLTAEGARDALDGRIPRYTPLKTAWDNRAAASDSSRSASSRRSPWKSSRRCSPFSGATKSPPG